MQEELTSLKNNFVLRSLFDGTQKMDDIYSVGLLQPLLVGYPFLPITGFAIRPFCLMHMLNDIIINSRKSVLEFGAGASTILIGRLIKKNKLETRLLSVDHDEEWVNVMRGMTALEGIDDVVKVIHAPLAASTLAMEDNTWYDTVVLDRQVQGRRFDMVIVDGPPAFEAGKAMARYPALPYVSDKLHPAFSVYLDDVERAGEDAILELWKDAFGFEFTITGNSLAFYYGGMSFFTEPTKTY